MPKYRIVYKQKVDITKPNEPTEYRLVTAVKKLRAESFKEAREKIRKSSGYDIVSISVEQLRPSWLARLFGAKR